MATVHDMALRGHLTAPSLKEALDGAELALGGAERPALLVDVLQMTGYDTEARFLFVSWNSANRTRIAGVAIVTTNRLWVMIIAAMAIASGQKMKAFDSADSATAWCRAL
jgi:SpoIIAA-like